MSAAARQWLVLGSEGETPRLAPCAAVGREEHLGSPNRDEFESESGELGKLRVFSRLKDENEYYCPDGAAVGLW